MNRIVTLLLLIWWTNASLSAIYGNQKWIAGSYCGDFNTSVDSLKESNFLPCNISEDLVLSEENSPYYVNCDIVVEPQATLGLNPGVEIIFLDSCSIRIFGKFSANGSPDKPIVLRPVEGLPFWDTICLINAADTCTFRWINILNGRLFAQNTHVVMDNVSQFNSKHLFWTDGLFTSFNGSLKITGSRFESNNTGEGLIFTYPEDAHVENCLFIRVPDAIEYLNITGGLVKDNVIIDPNDDGIDMNHSVDAVITGNQVFSAQDNGITLDSCQNILVENNLLVDCSQGINFKNNAHGMLRNNTLYRNLAGIYLYEKYAGSGGGHVIMENCILSQSVNKAIDADEYSSYTITYSLCDTESFPGSGNLNDSPEFISVTDSNFRLKPQSPCIDAGNPDQTDPDGSRADMGAFFFNKGMYSIIINEINYHSSNEFNSGDWTELYNPEQYEADISGWYFISNNPDQHFRFGTNTVIPSGGFLILCSDKIRFLTSFPGISAPWVLTGDSLFNNGGYLVLHNEAGILIDSLTYSYEPPWPEHPNGNGPTLELKNPFLDNSHVQNWAASTGYGTPGEVNSCFTQDIQEENAGNQIGLFPNPAAQYVSVDAGRATILSVQISDLNGKELRYIEHTGKNGNHPMIIPTNTLLPGIYLLSIKAKNDGKLMIISKKLVITG